MYIIYRYVLIYTIQQNKSKELKKYLADLKVYNIFQENNSILIT